VQEEQKPAEATETAPTEATEPAPVEAAAETSAAKEDAPAAPASDPVKETSVLFFFLPLFFFFLLIDFPFSKTDDTTPAQAPQAAPEPEKEVAKEAAVEKKENTKVRFKKSGIHLSCF
jgi:hypothetical protein